MELAVVVLAAGQGKRMHSDTPTKGYGRVVRDKKSRRVTRIVEEKDATPDERAIRDENASASGRRRPCPGRCAEALARNRTFFDNC